MKYLIIFLLALIFLVVACVPRPAVSLINKSTQPDLTPGILGSLEDNLPTRTPAPTPIAGPIDRAVSDLLEERELATQVVLGLTVEEWVSVVSGIVFFVLIYIIGLWLIRTPLRWLVKRTPTDFDDRYFSSVQRQIRILLIIIGLDLGLRSLSFVDAGFRRFLGDVFFIFYLLMIMYLVWRLVLFTSEWYRNRISDRISKQQYEALDPLIRRVILVILLSLAFAILLDHFGYAISAVTLIAILVFLIYVTARDVLSDAINGFIILFDQPFRVGDRIKTHGMDTWGDVIDIGTRTTRILTYDNRLVVIPNKEIANKQVDNYTYPDPTYRMELDIGIQYGSNVRQVQETIAKAISEVSGVLEDKPVEVLLIEFGESGLIFRVRWWVVTQTDFYVISNLVNLAMIDALAQTGIEISFTTFNIINHQPGSDDARLLSKPAGDGG